MSADVAVLSLGVDSGPVRTATSDLDRFSAQGLATEATLRRLLGATETAVSMLERIGARAQAASAGVDRMGTSASSAASGVSRLESELQAIYGVQERLSSSTIGVIRGYEDLIAKLTMTERAYAGISAVRRAGVEADSQSAQVVEALALAHFDLARGIEASAQAERERARDVAKASSVRAAIDPAGAARAGIVAEMAEYTRLAEKGLLTTTELARALDGAQLRMDAIHSPGAANDNRRNPQLRYLSYQVSDIATQVAMGGVLDNPLYAAQIGIAQGSDIYQILKSGDGVKDNLSQIRSGLSGIVTVGRLAFAGIAAGAVAATAATLSYVSAQKDLEQALQGTARASGQTLEGINRQAAEGALAAGVSRSSAREYLSTFASSGLVGPQTSGRLLGQTRNVAYSLGTDEASAAQLLTRSFSDPARGAEVLNEKLGFLNATTLRLIQTQTEQGRVMAAQKTLFDAMVPSLTKVDEKTNALTKFWELQKRGASNLYDFVGEGIARIVSPTAQQRLDALRLDPGASSEERMRLEEEIEQRSRRTAVEALRTERNRLSLESDKIVREVTAEEESFERLENRLTRLRATTSDANVEQDKLALATERLRGAVDSHLTSEQRRQASDALTLRSIEARTDVQRAQIASEQKLLELAGQQYTSEERRRAALAASNAELERSSRAADDRLRASRNELELAGRLPYDRQRVAIEQQFRINQEEGGGTPEARARNEAARANQLRSLGIEAVGGPQREATLRLGEQSAALRLQSEAFAESAEGAARLAERQRLLNEYVRAGVPITDDLRGRIDDLSRQYGRTAGAADDLSRRQQNITGGLDDLRTSSRGAITGFVSDLREGRSVLDGLQTALKRIQDQLVDRLISRPITEALLGQDGKGGGGLVGSGIGRLFGSGQTAVSTANVSAGVVNVGGTGAGGLGAGGLGTQTSRMTIDPDGTRTLESSSGMVPPVRPPGIGVGTEPAVPTTMPSATVGPLMSAPAPGTDALPSIVGAGGKFSNSLGMPQATSEASDAVRAGGTEIRESMSVVATQVEESGSGIAGVFSRLARSLDSGSSPGGGGLARLLGLGGDASKTSGGTMMLSAESFDSGLPAAAFATGGIMTSRGRIPLARYAAGGVASSPQLALFGEGRSPEAYVPLPDGRSIPVTMRGGVPPAASGGATTEVHVHEADGTRATVSESTGPRGPRMDVQIEQLVAAAVDRGAIDRSMSARYGSRRMMGR